MLMRLRGLLWSVVEGHGDWGLDARSRNVELLAVERAGCWVLLFA